MTVAGIGSVIDQDTHFADAHDSAAIEVEGNAVADLTESSAVGLSGSSATLPDGPKIDPPVVVDTVSTRSDQSRPVMIGWSPISPSARANTRYPKTGP